VANLSLVSILEPFWRQQEEWWKVITQKGQGLTAERHQAPINEVIDDPRLFTLTNCVHTWFNIGLAGVFCRTGNAECTGFFCFCLFLFFFYSYFHSCLLAVRFHFICWKRPHTIECCPLQQIKAICKQTWVKLTRNKQTTHWAFCKFPLLTRKHCSSDPKGSSFEGLR